MPHKSCHSCTRMPHDPKLRCTVSIWHEPTLWHTYSVGCVIGALKLWQFHADQDLGSSPHSWMPLVLHFFGLPPCIGGLLCAFCGLHPIWWHSHVLWHTNSAALDLSHSPCTIMPLWHPPKDSFPLTPCGLHHICLPWHGVALTQHYIYFLIIIIIISIFKVTAKPDTKLVYETPLFVGQGTHLRAAIWLLSLRKHTYSTPLWFWTCDLLGGNTCS